MTDRVKNMLALLRSKEYRKQRISKFWDIPGFHQLDEFRQSTVFMAEMLSRQEPLLFENDIFGFNRYLIDRPGVDANSHVVIDGNKYFERYSNITPAYEMLIDRGVDDILAELSQRAKTTQGDALALYTEAANQVNAMVELADRYRKAAEEAGVTELAQALCRVPRQKPTSLYEALVFEKLLVFVLRCAHYKHLTLGRFDQYMLPYYTADKASGKTDEELLEIVELFFLSLNVDSDLYPGIQQGDNGQSMVLGGYKIDGTSCYNGLTELCLQASLDLSLIDPKINLRVNKTTPDSVYATGTKLTKQGLGFPQYLNDDVIIPGLIKLGYEPEDAAEYTVAACWEPIIPGKGADIPNEIVFSFPPEMINAINGLEECPDEETLWSAVKQAIDTRCQTIIDTHASPDKYYFRRPLPVSPLISLMMHGCVESGKDIGRFGTRYYNCGAFGAGLSTAADSIAAIRKVLFTDGKCDWATLKKALQEDFEGHTELRNSLLSAPKMGGEDASVNEIAARLMGIYIQALNGKPNGTGGIWRSGTGSAQNYIYDGAKCGATPDGRKAGHPYACSFSPAPGVRVGGPLSVIRAFTSFDLTDCINGGPLTMELHHNVFRNAEGEDKVAKLVKLFILSGGHQLQLNALNREELLDAQKHPEDHSGLVVRVWGWSGYFCELDKEFQNHIISRTQYQV